MRIGKKLVVVVNQEKILEYDRTQPLPGKQRQFLESMDMSMDTDGITFDEKEIATPDLSQKSYYVANMLVNALLRDNDAMAAATCAWMATRLPDVQQVKAQVDEESIKMELVLDSSYEDSQQQQPLVFKPDHKLN